MDAFYAGIYTFGAYQRIPGAPLHRVMWQARHQLARHYDDAEDTPRKSPYVMNATGRSLRPLNDSSDRWRQHILAIIEEHFVTH
eukprot:6188198-Pleurochrysis_carterae.AAC.3